MRQPELYSNEDKLSQISKIERSIIYELLFIYYLIIDNFFCIHSQAQFHI